GRVDEGSRGAHAGIPAAVDRAGAVADVRQLDLPGPSLPAPPDARAGAAFPLPQPRRQHDQGACAALGAGSPGRRAQGGLAYCAERRARFDRGAEALPYGDGGVRRAALTRRYRCPHSCGSGFSRELFAVAWLPPLRRQGRAGEGGRRDRLEPWPPPPSLPLPSQGEEPGQVLAASAAPTLVGGYSPQTPPTKRSRRKPASFFLRTPPSTSPASARYRPRYRGSATPTRSPRPSATAPGPGDRSGPGRRCRRTCPWRGRS